MYRSGRGIGRAQRTEHLALLGFEPADQGVGPVVRGSEDDVPLKQFAEAIGENYKALHKTPSRASLQEKLLPVERAIALLDESLRDRGRVRAWLNTPHPDLGGRTALGVILEGHATMVSDMLGAAAAGLVS